MVFVFILDTTLNFVKEIGLIRLNLAKAFDSVPHYKLISKLKSFATSSQCNATQNNTFTLFPDDSKYYRAFHLEVRSNVTRCLGNLIFF